MPCGRRRGHLATFSTHFLRKIVFDIDFLSKLTQNKSISIWIIYIFYMSKPPTVFMHYSCRNTGARVASKSFFSASSRSATVPWTSALLLHVPMACQHSQWRLIGLSWPFNHHTQWLRSLLDLRFWMILSQSSSYDSLLAWLSRDPVRGDILPLTLRLLPVDFHRPLAQMSTKSSETTSSEASTRSTSMG